MNSLYLKVLLLGATMALHAQAQPAVLDADMQRVLDQLAKLEPKPIETLTAKEARKQPSIADAVLRLAIKPGPPGLMKEKVGENDDYEILGAAGKIKVRVYTPKGDGPFPVVVYYHGGGWVIADLDTYDASGRALANAAGAVVVSVHYRQAPENKFPAPHDDAVAAYRWALANLKKLHGIEGKVAVAGESAGGNLAASVAISARDEGFAAPAHQLLVYPVTDFAFDKASYKQNANAKPLNAAMMRWFFEQTATPADASNPRLSVLRADLTGVAPATVITAEVDPLKSDGQLYAEKLKAAGVSVAYRNYDGVTHEFFGLGALVAKAKEAETFAGEQLKAVFAIKK